MSYKLDDLDFPTHYDNPTSSYSKYSSQKKHFSCLPWSKTILNYDGHSITIVSPSSIVPIQDPIATQPIMEWKIKSWKGHEVILYPPPKSYMPKAS